jgi:OOP family OmpA-OmpF porin
MKKIVMLTIILMLTAVVTVAQAEVKAGSVSITPFAGGYFFERSQDLKDTAVYGLRAGYNFTKNIGLEGYFSYLQTEFQDQSQWEPWQDVYSFGIEGLYHFMPESRLVPFIAIGFGGIYYGKGFNYINSSYGDDFEASQYTVDYGAGLKFFLTDDIALRADVRDIIPLNSTKGNPDYFHNNLLVTLGINFAFGGEKKIVEAKVEEPKVEEPPAPVAPAAPAEVVVDSDKDGIPDNLDKCPNTPAGVSVDKDGCPLDSDKDGVPDYLDKCPNTPAGVAVDKDGCPPDSDKDGVPDYLDKCPDTPAGAIVDENGCVHEKVSMTLNVEFDTAKAVIKKKYHNELKKVADFIKAFPGTNAVIEGHTDNVDRFNNPENNIRLSQARADSVRQYLIDNFGIDASRITAVGYGPDKPIASNDTKEGRQKNRRVHAVIETMKIK